MPPQCKFNGCKTQAHYNVDSQQLPLYCSKHKLENMIDLVHTTCLYINCKTQPNFNYEHEKKPLYCSKHKLDGMVDIKNTKCL